MSEDILQREQSTKTQFSVALSERYLAYALSLLHRVLFLMCVMDLSLFTATTLRHRH